jgi:hypothetical protein
LVRRLPLVLICGGVRDEAAVFDIEPARARDADARGAAIRRLLRPFACGLSGAETSTNIENGHDDKLPGGGTPETHTHMQHAEGVQGQPAEYRVVARLAFVLVAATLAVAATALAGGIADEPCMNVAGENTNTCPSGQVGVPYSLRFVEREGSGCGPGRQTFRFDSGVLPPGLTLAAEGILSGTPTQAGMFQFYVEMREPQDDPAHCAGKQTQKQFTLTVCRRLGIVSSPAPLPAAEVRVPFRLNLSWCDGLGAVTWAPSGILPPGLTLRANGSIVGAPRAAGTYRFTATAKDVRSRVARYSGSISVAAGLRIRTPHILPARVDRPYRARLAETGGVAPKSWRITRGRLPRGIRLDPRGILSGEAERAGRHRITVEVRDVLRVKATRTITFVVLASPGKRLSRRG